MTFNKSLIAALIGTAMCFPAVAADSSGFKKRFYIGASAGSSTLEPEIESGLPFTIQDDSDSAFKGYIGFDVTPRFAAEISAADLGEAEIGPDSAGTVFYDVIELSGLWHLFKFGGRENLLDRKGLGAFVKLGVGVLDNSSNLEFRRENDIHLSGGVGVELGTRIGLAFRAELEAFDEDAMLASGGLLWRFGGGSTSKKPKKAESTVDDSAIGGLTSNAPPLLTDDDNDGVPNSIDDCSGTAVGEPVDATGCPVFGGTLEGVQFAVNSDQLLDEAQAVLNDAADVLLANPDVKVEVQAHTDSQGPEDFNIELSKKRALSTVRYLMLRGVPSEQMAARAFGESKPIDDNGTPEGRAANRRVEFHVIER